MMSSPLVMKALRAVHHAIYQCGKIFFQYIFKSDKSFENFKIRR